MLTVTFKDRYIVNCETVRRLDMLSLKPPASVIKLFYYIITFNNVIILLKNYIIHDSDDKSPPIR